MHMIFRGQEIEQKLLDLDKEPQAGHQIGKYLVNNSSSVILIRKTDTGKFH